MAYRLTYPQCEDFGHKRDIVLVSPKPKPDLKSEN